MSEANCKRELELEIPAENVQKAAEKVTREIARIARIPGFRPGKAPVTLVRRRFAEDIQGEVVQSLVPDFLEKALTEKKLYPVSRPQVHDVQFTDGGPLKFRAAFEVLPEVELKDYKNLEVQIEDAAIGDKQVHEAIEEMRERAAKYVPVEGRAVQNGDFVQMKLIGAPEGGGDPVRAENAVCHIGSEETLEAFTENLRGLLPGEKKDFQARYPEDYPDRKLAGKTYRYTAEVREIKEKKLPELNDEFAKDVAGSSGEFSTLAELRAKVRQRLEAARSEQRAAQTRERILDLLVERHDFPVPESLVENQMDVRLERTVRALAAQGVDPRAVNVDWVSLRRRQRERAVKDVKAEILLDSIATKEKIEATDEDLEKETGRLAEQSGESAASLRARLTKEGAVDRMKSKLRSDKTLEWLIQNARIQTSQAHKS